MIRTEPCRYGLGYEHARVTWPRSTPQKRVIGHDYPWFPRISVDPATRIPVELMSEIFVLLLPDEFVEPDNTAPPLSVSRVCRKWRTIALSTPRIWSSLSIIVRRPHFNYARMMRTWLERAHRSDLTVTLASSGQEEILRCIFELTTFAAALRCLRVLVPLDYFSALECLFGCPMPRLQQIEYRLWDAHGGDYEISSKRRDTRIVAAPRTLQSPQLGLHTHDLSLCQELIFLPLERLTRLVLLREKGSVGDLRALRSCQNLISFELIMRHCDGSIAWPIITLPALQQLKVQFESIVNLVGYLNLPKLRILDIGECMSSRWFAANTHSICSMIKRSKCSIEHLFLHLIRDNTLEVTELLKTTPKLSTLSISAGERGLPQSLLTALTWNSRLRAFAPCLQRLSIEQHGCPRIIPRQEIKRMIFSRRSTDADISPDCLPPGKAARLVYVHVRVYEAMTKRSEIWKVVGADGTVRKIIKRKK